MMTLPRRFLPAGLAVPSVLLCLGLGACGFSPPETAVQREAADDCRQEVNRSFDAQHREYLTERDASDTPFSAETAPPLPSDGLSDRYAYESAVGDCIGRSAAVPVINNSK